MRPQQANELLVVAVFLFFSVPLSKKCGVRKPFLLVVFLFHVNELVLTVVEFILQEAQFL